ncbi:MAG: IPT/TIG domain-containing protein, partial [Planctomycetota bacterium]
MRQPTSSVLARVVSFGLLLLTASPLFAQAPTVSSVSPPNGSPLGGDVVTITGADLTVDTSVTFGGTPAASVTFVNATTLDATTPAHAPGAVDVAVANANGSDTLTAAFTFDAPPTLVSIAPTSGSPLGGTVVTLTGTAFTAATSVTFGGTPAASVTFVNATTLDATTPAHAPGAVDVAVANANGSDTLTAAFTFDAPPTLVSIAPTSGSPLGGTVVTLTGTAFTAATSVTFGGTPAASVTFVSATTLDATTPAHAPGAVDVAVANANGSDTLTAAFTFDAPPTLVSIAPTSGSPLG